jgi:hypothetical protein
MRDLYMKDAHIFVVVFSFTAKSTFCDLEDILEQIERVRDGKPYSLVIAGM